MPTVYVCDKCGAKLTLGFKIPKEVKGDAVYSLAYEHFCGACYLLKRTEEVDQRKQPSEQWRMLLWT